LGSSTTCTGLDDDVYSSNHDRECMSWERSEMGRSDSEEKSEVGGAGSEGCVSIHLYGEGRDYHLPPSLDLPLVKSA
jgi:hypothetical protein